LKIYFWSLWREVRETPARSPEECDTMLRGAMLLSEWDLAGLLC